MTVCCLTVLELDLFLITSELYTVLRPPAVGRITFAGGDFLGSYEE